MYGLPEDVDLSMFSGCTLESVTFTQNTIHLAFDRSTSITLESSYAYYSGVAANAPEHKTVPPVGSQLMRLVGHSVALAARSTQGGLLLQFDDGQSLDILDDSTEYESFRITVGDREIVV